MTDFETFYHHWREPGFQFALRLTKNIERAHDIVSVAFEKLLAMWPEVRQPKAPALFFTFIRHAITDASRAASVRITSSMDVVYGDDEVTPDWKDTAREPMEVLLGCELVCETATVVAMLNPLQQDIIECLMEEMTYENASAKLGVPVGTIRSSLARARRRIAKVCVGRSLLSGMRTKDAA